jgi:zinc transporter ZupT
VGHDRPRRRRDLPGPPTQPQLQDGRLGFAAGVMIAASYWSLLAPANRIVQRIVVPAVVGFLLGGAFLALIDVVRRTCTSTRKRPRGTNAIGKRSICW